MTKTAELGRLTRHSGASRGVDREPDVAVQR
jgi:hypothetical protein